VAWTPTFAPPRPTCHLPLYIEVGAPVYHDGVVYVGSPITDSEIALKAATGQLLWQHRLSGPVSSSALVAHGVVLVPVGNGRVVALDASSGRLLRTTNLGGQFSATYPMLLDRTVF
jgi:outer membrane protein assembly factor BamB